MVRDYAAESGVPFIALWCNGNTQDFGSCILCSSHSGATAMSKTLLLKIEAPSLAALLDVANKKGIKKDDIVQIVCSNDQLYYFMVYQMTIKSEDD